MMIYVAGNAETKKGVFDIADASMFFQSLNNFVFSELDIPSGFNLFEKEKICKKMAEASDAVCFIPGWEQSDLQARVVTGKIKKKPSIGYKAGEKVASRR